MYAYSIDNKCNVAPYQSGGMYTDPYYGDTMFVGTRVYFKCHTSYYLRCGGPALCMPGHLGDFAGMLCVCEGKFLCLTSYYTLKQLNKL